MVISFFRDEVVRVRAPLVDDGRGGERRDFAQATRTPLSKVRVQNASAAELQSRPQVVAWLRGPVDMDVNHEDRIEALSLTGELVRYDVDAPPLRYVSPLGSIRYSKVELKAVDQ